MCNLLHADGNIFHVDSHSVVLQPEIVSVLIHVKGCLAIRNYLSALVLILGLAAAPLAALFGTGALALAFASRKLIA